MAAFYLHLSFTVIWVSFVLLGHGVFTVLASQNSSECLITQFRCTNGECTEGRYQCNGETDCRDGSDELGCGNYTCSPYQFMCDGKCIALQKRCNGVWDCRDGKDELRENCKANARCPSGYFKCGNGQCISGADKCDGTRDCQNGADEKPSLCDGCSEEDFRCRSGGRCLPMWKLCDGRYDCDDFSDERKWECTRLLPKCPDGQFRCKNRLCLKHDWVCDGESDCGPSGEDEDPTLCQKLSLNGTVYVHTNL